MLKDCNIILILKKYLRCLVQIVTISIKSCKYTYPLRSAIYYLIMYATKVDIIRFVKKKLCIPTYIGFLMRINLRQELLSETNK